MPGGIKILQTSALAVTVPAGAINVDGTGAILTFNLEHSFSKVGLEVTNSHGSVAFDEFAIHVQVVEGGAWEILLPTGTTWGTETSTILFGDVALSTLAAAAAGSLILQVNNPWAIRVMASGNVAASEAGCVAWAAQ